jgi:uncharacterized protein (DUF4415 family)
MKTMLLMRMQGMEQEVCQLLFATFRQMFDSESDKGPIFTATLCFCIYKCIYFCTLNTYITARPAKRPSHTGALMKENNQITEIQALDGLKLGSMPSSAKEKSVENSDFSNLSGAVFLQAKRAEHVPAKKQVSLRIDEDILEYFKYQGSRYQTKMHAVLRAYVDEKILNTSK